jgi:hypothetical protein
MDFVPEDVPDYISTKVRARSSVTARDLGGLGGLLAACGRRFRCGLVLHDGKQVYSFANQMFVTFIVILRTGTKA